MNKRNKFITTLLLTISLILTNLLPVMGMKIAEDPIDVAEAALDSAGDAEATINFVDWVDIIYHVRDFKVINLSDTGDHLFSEIAPEPYGNVLLTSFTNVYEEMILGAESSKADEIYLYNNGSITASENEPYHHWVTTTGFDGHGETFYINSNFFDLSDDDLNNLKLGKLVDDRYYHPTPGLAVFPDSMADDTKTLIPSLSVVHNDYYKPNQTWIKVSYRRPLTKEEEIQAYKDSFPNRIYYTDTDFIEVASGNKFTGRKLKPEVSEGKTIINTVAGDDNKISEIYDTFYYSSKNKKQIRVKYKNNKNAGTASVTVKKFRERPELNGKELKFEIEPVTVSDDNIKPTVKNGTVKSVKVLTGGKYKKVKKTMWSVNGKEITFTGNYKGTVSLNSI